MLLVVYDEHGGFFDSVAPPDGMPNPDGKVFDVPPGFDFTRLGGRVPAIVISAYTDPGVDETLFEHSSVPASLKELFGLPTFLTERDAAANTFLRFADRSTPRTDAPMTIPSSAEDAPATVAPRAMNLLHKEIVDMADGLLTRRGIEPSEFRKDHAELTDHDAGAYFRAAMELLMHR